MRSLFLFLSFSLVIGSSFAQELVGDLETKGVDEQQFTLQTPSEGTQLMSLGSHNAFSLVLDGVESKLVMDTWKDFIKGYKGKTKKVKRSSELFSEDVNAAIIGPNSVDIYSLVEKKGDGSVVSVWFDQGGSFINSADHADGGDGVVFFLNEFQKKVNVEKIKIELSDQSKELKERERVLAKLQSANEKLHKQIEDWQSKIVKAEADIESNVSNQADAEQMIQDQKDKVHAVEIKLAKAEAQ